MKRLFAILLALALVFAFAACTPKETEDPTTTAPSEEVDGTTVADETTTEAPTDETTTEAPTDETTTEAPKEGETTTEAPKEGETTTKAPAPAINAPVGKGAKEVVAFYNQVANASKAYTGKLTITKKEGTETKVEKFNAALKSVAANLLPNDWTDAKNQSKTFTNGAASDGTKIKDYMPIYGDAKMSKLDVAGVASATCVAEGSGWKVTIKLKEETDKNLTGLAYRPVYHAQCMPPLELKPEDLDPFALKNGTLSYRGGTVTAVVNKDGRLDSLKLDEPVYADGKVGHKSVPIDFAAEISGAWHQHSTFKYE